MFDLWPMSSIIVEYNPSIVFLSVVISFLGAYTAISFCDQLRMFTVRAYSEKQIHRHGYLVLISISLGGVGIWCMHFVGMSSVKLYGPDDQLLKIRYNGVLTLISLFLVLLFTYVGIYISALDCVFSKSKQEIVEMFVAGGHHLSLKQIKGLNFYKSLQLISTNSLGKLSAGGIITGAGVIVMHYVGMAALNFHGEIVWNYGVIVGSMVIAFVAASAAFWILFRFLSLYSSREWLRLTSSALMATAVCGMHYTGMVAAGFQFRTQPPKDNVGLLETTSNDAFFASVIGSMGVLWILNIILIGDIRRGVHKMNNDLSRAEAVCLRFNIDPGMGSTYSSTGGRRYSLGNGSPEKEINPSVSVTHKAGLGTQSFDDISSNIFGRGSVKVIPVDTNHENKNSEDSVSLVSGTVTKLEISTEV